MAKNDNDRLGELSQTSDGWELRFRRRLGRPPSTVWRAFTDPELRKQWFPDVMEGDIKAGAPLKFIIEKFDIPPFDGEVLEIDEPRLLVIRWGTDILRFEVSEHDDGALFTLTVQFTQHGKAARDGAGWHVCLAHLVTLFTAADSASPSWSDIHPAYVAAFGPEASAIGPPAELS
jgi:uncharacterized protein YndB with AHSA1/START domain